MAEHPPVAEEVIRRFWAKVDRRGPDECWPWIGGFGGTRWGGKQYGVFRFEGRTVTAHRVSWIIEHGPIPEGMRVLHECDNPPCVNPGDLFLGTQRDNIEDMVRKGRNAAVAGERHYRAKLTEEQVVEIRRLRKEHGIAYKALAHRFGVCQQTIGWIVTGGTWKCI
jgi:hypothetical protein